MPGWHAETPFETEQQRSSLPAIITPQEANERCPVHGKRYEMIDW